MRMKIIFWLAIVVIALTSISFVSAQVIIGVSPGNVNFKDVLRGGYAERQLSVTADSTESVLVGLEAGGEIADWLNFSDVEFRVSRSNPGKPVIYLTPPSDMPNGNYTGYIRVKTSEINGENSEGHAVGNIIAVLDVAISVEIVDTEIFSCAARSFEIESVEKGEDLRISFEYNNNGNIRMKPRLIVDIWDVGQTKIIKHIDMTENDVLPTRKEKVSFFVPTDDLEVSQYWAEVSVTDCFSSDLLTFDVLEPGTLRADGIITSIVSVTWAELGETIPIIVNFENTGAKSIVAQFKGQISLEGRIVDILESEESRVEVSDNTNFTFYFTPKSAGKYIMEGRVFYDNKRTFESSKVINVKPKKSSWGTIWAILGYIALIVLAIVLIYKIRKERRKFF
ncbi:hypothetical protein COU60_00015 [Candidatus Pacearchaeota archaeon CG10_big_fil_rev_8_21_14_0_10_34_76]|nr:MAG: hypothetical protein COU60_00015 [Candidatus Pacearchaeota archaeon CG10_big_fil_rev_8_21_14_0_10_34_76]